MVPNGSRARFVGLTCAWWWAVMPLGQAEAHPHVWIDSGFEFRIDDAALRSIHVSWTLDEIVSALLIADFDPDETGAFTGDRLDALRESGFETLEEFDYYLHPEQDGSALARPDIDDFDAEIKDGRVIYRFRAAFSQPVALADKPLDLGVYDETFWTDVQPDEDAIVISNGAGENCMTEVFRDAGNSIYFGLVDPPVIRVACEP